jgi:hypothetical protein
VFLSVCQKLQERTWEELRTVVTGCGVCREGVWRNTEALLLWRAGLAELRAWAQRVGSVFLDYSGKDSGGHVSTPPRFSLKLNLTETPGKI